MQSIIDMLHKKLCSLCANNNKKPSCR